MKKILTLICIAAATLASRAAERSDTLTTLVHPDSVTVTVTPSSLSVTANGRQFGQTYTYEYTTETEAADIDGQWDIELPFTRSQSDPAARTIRHWAIFSLDECYVGLTRCADAPGGMRGGWEIGLRNVLGLRYTPVKGGPDFTLGIGLGYRSANVSHGAHLEGAGGVLTIVPTPEGVKASSRMHLFRFEIPLMLKQRIWRSLAIKVGGILNLNTYMKATTKEKADGVTTKTVYKDLHQRFATVDLYGALGLDEDISLYVRYSPARVFDTGFGPCFRQLSFGITIGF